MVHSTWGTWFVREEVEGTTPDGVAVWYLGCNGFIVRSATVTLYIDPYFGEGDPPEIVRMIPVPLDPGDATDCDAVLATHEHIDHMHPPSYDPLVNELGADIVAPAAAFEEPHYDGDMRVPRGRRQIVTAGDHLRIGDFDVYVRPANDPDAIEPVSYVIEHDAGTFFHGGDTRPAAAFHDLAGEFDIDLGVLPIGSVGRIFHIGDDEVRPTRWYMDENQIIEAANALELDRLLPSHYDMWKGVGADAKVLHEHAGSFPYPRVIERVTIGDRVDLGSPGIVPPCHLAE